jgi:hypothetical protein
MCRKKFFFIIDILYISEKCFKVLSLKLIMREKLRFTLFHIQSDYQKNLKHVLTRTFRKKKKYLQ